ncbi:ferrous iron transport protein B [Candidatus Bathyarchaeota archaeon RBG_16_48_13]|nr:MAG: ferrous iron transport protein B [Candidatus Bathyarchaeota archaeon RBG_16_48_13]
MSCHSGSSNSKKSQNNGRITIALAGNANVGKSVLFNQLTGSSQIIGNWPGKTVEKAEGTLNFEGQKITVVDLPGIYSFSTFGMEEIVSREYVALEDPDVVINVVDAAVLERNLFFTLQLIEIEAPLVICLNQVDAAKNKGISIDRKKLEQALGVPVVPTVVIRGEGIYELTKTALVVARNCSNNETPVRYGAEIEERISKLDLAIQTGNLGLRYPSRWVAIKLLENDPEIKKLVSSKSDGVIKTARTLAEEISSIHNEPCFAVIASERYSLASKVANEVQRQSEVKTTLSEKLNWITTHKMFGYITSVGVIAALLIWTFSIGNFLSTLFSDALSLFSSVNPSFSGSIQGIIWNGVYGGLVAGITLVVPYVVPFYLMLAMIEDSGILTRVAFMMDSAMHTIGLHGKALIPMILGYGCNVPAIQACRIMETKRERLLASYAITFAPCAARTIVILGLVAAFVGPTWALSLYAVDIMLIFVLGKAALKVVPGKSTGLIMEMHSFKVPSLSVVTKQTWARTKSLIYFVFPLYIVGSALIQVLFAVGILQYLSNAFSPLTVGWLGLPAIAGILLILGLVRKELTLLGAVAIFGSTNLALFFTPVQLITLALVSIIFIPCISTVTVLAKDHGWKAASVIAIANFATAIVVGGIAFRLLSLIL